MSVGFGVLVGALGLAGRRTGEGRIVHRDGDLVFLEASLLDPDAAVIATATAMARVIALDRAPAAV